MINKVVRKTVGNYGVWVVIVTFNSEKDIGMCLSSVGREGFRVLVVDNASSDETFAVIKRSYRWASILRNRRNFGFATGANRGMRVAVKNGASYVVVLNPDTVVRRGELGKLVRFLSEDEMRGVAGPAIEHRDPLGGGKLWDLGGRLNWLFGRTTHLNVRRLFSDQEPSQRDYVSGCCMAIKRKVFQKIGFFDDCFFMYSEDVDYCVRAKRAGFTIWNVPGSVVFHKRTGSSGELSRFSGYHLTKSALIFGQKWLDLPRRVLELCWVLFQCVLFARVNLEAGEGAFRAVAEGIFSDIVFLKKS